MVYMSLKLKANLENIETLTPAGTDFRWYLKFACSNCQTESTKWNYMSLAEEVQPKDNVKDSTCHYAEKCKFCQRLNSVAILPDTIKPLTAEGCTEFNSIVIFDCRGMDPKDYSPREGWTVKTVNNGRIFEDVDLSEGEWADYCDKTSQPVGVYEIEHQFETVKKVKSKFV